ncbi:MAG: hypothetical protein AAFY82_07380 [Pseudomonadota bacterium]
MRWLISALMALTCSVCTAQADTSEPQASEAAQVLQAAWSAALILPESKHGRLAPAFLEIAVLSEDQDLLREWERRLDQSASLAPSYADYGWQAAEPILQRGGVRALIDIAKRRAAPLSFGRADVLLAAGKRLAADRPEDARQINQALMDLTGGASKFERVILAHAAAELAMTRCDRDLFDRAERSTSAPGNLRYAFWRARFTGSVLPLLARVRAIESGEDTREVRRVLEGYRAIQELGYCAAPKS